MDLVLTFAWTMVAGTLAGIILALWGSHLSARGQAVQVACMSQGAVFGVLCGMLFMAYMQTRSIGTAEGWFSVFGPTLFGMTVAFFITQLTQVVARTFATGLNTFLMALFASLMALNAMLGAIFPMLERHLSRVYFGDLVTLSTSQAQIIAVFAGMLIVGFRFFHRQTTLKSFEMAIFGMQEQKRGVLTARAYEVLLFGFVCYALQHLGFLFVLGCLFIPQSLLTLSRPKNVRQNQLLLVVLTGFALPTAFLVSLFADNLPTVPTMVCFLTWACLSWALMSRMSFRFHGNQ